MDADKTEQFTRLLVTASDGTTEERGPAWTELNNLLSHEYVLFLALAADAGNRATGKIVYFSLVAIKDALKVTRMRSLDQMRRILCTPDVAPVRNSIKTLSANNLVCDDYPIRNLSAAVVAEMIQIECAGDWSFFTSVLSLDRNLPIPVVVNLFSEIFQLKAFTSEIPFDSLPPQLEHLMSLISQQLKNPETPVEGKDSCTRCLMFMTKAVPQFFQTEERYKNLFGLFREILPSASPALFFQIYRVILQLVESLYFITNGVMADVFEISVMCLQAPILEARLLSLEFWLKLWKFEKGVAKKQRVCSIGCSRNTSHSAQMIFRVASAAPQLTGQAISILRVVKMSDGTPEIGECLPEERVFRVLKSFFKAMKASAQYEAYVNAFMSVVGEFSGCSDPSDVNVLIYLLRIATLGCSNAPRLMEEMQAFVIEQISVGTMAATSELPRLCDNGLGFLTDLAKKFPVCIANDAIFDALFTTFTRVMPGPVYLQVKAMQMMMNVLRSAPPTFVDGVYDDIFEIIIERIDNPEFEDLQYSSIAFRTMNVLLSKCSSKMNWKLVALVSTLLSRIESAPLDRKSSYLGMITCIIQHVKAEIQPKLSEICGFLFHLLENKSEMLYLEAMICFSSVILSAKTEFMPYAPDFMRVVVNALNSGIPRLVHFAAMAFGDFCQIAGKANYERIEDTVACLFRIIDVTRQADEVTQQTVVPGLLLGMAMVFDGMGDAINGEFVQQFWDAVIFYANTNIDFDSENDRDYAVTLYVGVFQALASLFRGLSHVEPRHVAQTKKFVIPIFDKAWKLKSDDLHLLQVALDLIEAIATKLGSTVCIPLRRESIRCLLAVASDHPNQQLRKRGVRDTGLVDRL